MAALVFHTTATPAGFIAAGDDSNRGQLLVAKQSFQQLHATSSFLLHATKITMLLKSDAPAGKLAQSIV
jgi:hypothetical protein